MKIAPGDDVSQEPYFVLTNKSPLINLLFAALLDRIICRTTKRGLLLILSASEGRDLDAKFAKMVPKIKDDENDKWLVGAEILAYLQYLIYSAAFKDLTVEPRGSIYGSFTEAGAEHFASMKILSAER